MKKVKIKRVENSSPNNIIKDNDAKQYLGFLENDDNTVWKEMAWKIYSKKY
jgi:hypothetical protein